MALGVDYCDDIPDETAADSEVYNFLNDSSSVLGFADEILDGYDPYGYQMNTELGYFAPNSAHLTGDLLYYDDYSPAVYLPQDATATFDNTAFLSARDWAEESGEELLMIYGQNDPWTAAAINLDAATDSALFTVADGTHMVTLDDLDETDTQAAHDLLEAWTGIEIQE